MERHRQIRLDYNPHVRGMQFNHINPRLSDRAQHIYRILHLNARDEEESPCTKVKSPRRARKSRFSPVESSPTLISKRTASVKKLYQIHKSPSKDVITTKKREFSWQEEEQIENIVNKRLKSEISSIKVSIANKIKKLSRHNILPEEVNTLRVDSLTEVKSKKV